jgi:ribA/ribD-fused uncharacterized protein
MVICVILAIMTSCKFKSCVKPCYENYEFCGLKHGREHDKAKTKSKGPTCEFGNCGKTCYPGSTTCSFTCRDAVKAKGPTCEFGNCVKTCYPGSTTCSFTCRNAVKAKTKDNAGTKSKVWANLHTYISRVKTIENLPDKPVHFYNNGELADLFSNFYGPGQIPSGENEEKFIPAEVAYQSKKFPLTDTRSAEFSKLSPLQAFKAAREGYKGRIALGGKDWGRLKDNVMKRVLLQKFGGGPLAFDPTEDSKHTVYMVACLIATGTRTLYEDSPIDYYWGIGKTGDGENMLGKMLMKLRADFIVGGFDDIEFLKKYL